MDFIRRLIIFMICSFISYIIFLNYTAIFLNFFYEWDDIISGALYYTIFLEQTMFIYLMVNLIVNRKVYPILWKVVLIVYILMMFFIMFGRVTPTDLSLHDTTVMQFDIMIFLQYFFGFALFLPVGFLLRKLSFAYVCGIALMIVVGIEVAQYMTHRGLFDLMDIVLNIGSIVVAYIISRRNKMIFEV